MDQQTQHDVQAQPIIYPLYLGRNNISLQNTVDLFLATYLIYLPLPQSTSHRYTQIKSAEFHIVHPTRLLKNVLCMSVCM